MNEGEGGGEGMSDETLGRESLLGFGMSEIDDQTFVVLLVVQDEEREDACLPGWAGWRRPKWELGFNSCRCFGSSDSSLLLFL